MKMLLLLPIINNGVRVRAVVVVEISSSSSGQDSGC